MLVDDFEIAQTKKVLKKAFFLKPQISKSLFMALYL